MPYPVSPDPSVPEHPSNPSRTGQFPSDARPPAGPFGGGRPRPAQFGGGQPPADQPGGPGDPDQSTKHEGKSDGPRDWIWSAIAFLVAAAVIGAVAFYFFGPKGEQEAAVEWAVDSCAAPSAPSAESTGAVASYKPTLCDDAEAEVTILEIQDAVSVGQAHCPAGTDVLFQKDGEAGGTTRVVCARNLSDEHPGDPGMGGGQLLNGDCVDAAGTEIACTSDGARKVTGLIIGTNECPGGTADTIELGFDSQRSYQTICLGKA